MEAKIVEIRLVLELSVERSDGRPFDFKVYTDLSVSALHAHQKELSERFGYECVKLMDIVEKTRVELARL